MVTLIQAVSAAGHTLPLPLTLTQYRAGHSLNVGLVDLRQWSEKDLARLQLSRRVLIELTRRGVTGRQLQAFLGPDNARLPDAGAIDPVVDTMTAAQLVWQLQEGPASTLREIAGRERFALADRIEAIVQLDARHQAPSDTLRESINSLKESDSIQQALLRLKRRDVLEHFALKSTRHVWRPRVATHLLQHAALPLLEECTRNERRLPVKGIAGFLASAALSRAQLEAARDHPALGAQAAIRAQLQGRLDQLASLRTLDIDALAATVAHPRRAETPAEEAGRMSMALELTALMSALCEASPGTPEATVQLLSQLHGSATLADGETMLDAVLRN